MLLRHDLGLLQVSEVSLVKNDSLLSPLSCLSPEKVQLSHNSGVMLYIIGVSRKCLEEV